jgi:hypothetical protein
MSASTTAATAGAIAAQAVAQAIKASGAIVNLNPDNFSIIASKARNSLVVISYGGFLNKSYQYLLSYKGIFFYTKSPVQLSLPSDIETVYAKTIWIPG